MTVEPSSVSGRLCVNEYNTHVHVCACANMQESIYMYACMHIYIDILTHGNTFILTCI